MQLLVRILQFELKTLPTLFIFPACFLLRSRENFTSCNLKLQQTVMDSTFKTPPAQIKGINCFCFVFLI